MRPSRLPTGCGDRMRLQMPIGIHGSAVESASLIWPVAFPVPTSRFRLFAAADTLAAKLKLSLNLHTPP